MKKYWKSLTNIAVALFLLLLVIFFVPKVLILFLPFVVGWLIALLASPPVRFLERKLKIKRKAGSVFVILLVIGLVVLLLYLLGAKLSEELLGLISALPQMWENLESDFVEIGKNLSSVYTKLPINMQESFTRITSQIGDYAGELVGQIGTPTIAAVGNFAKQLPSVIINVIMTLLSAYFFVADRSAVNEWFRKNTPKTLQNRYHMIKQSMVKAVGGYFKAQLKIEIWMYLLLVIGLSILKVNYALLIAIGIAFLDFLPFFGTGTVMVPWAVIKFLSADYQLAIGLLIIWGVGQLARQMIQPKIVGDSIGVPPIPTLFLLYFGYRISGVIGMIVAVPLGLIVFTMYQEGYFDTTKNSILILVNGINHFRMLKKEDLESISVEKDDLPQENGTKQGEKHA